MTHRIQVYPHNDLFNTAHYHLGVINEKVDNDKKDAISLDCISCIIALSFGIEAFVNFLGEKKINDWDEREKFEKKIRKIHKDVGYKFDKGKEPFKTVWKLKLLRDSMAHGKPKRANVGAKSKEELWAHMKTSWDDSMNPEFVNDAYDKVKEWKKELLKAADLTLASTVTSAIGSGNRT